MMLDIEPIYLYGGGTICVLIGLGVFKVYGRHTILSVLMGIVFLISGLVTLFLGYDTDKHKVREYTVTEVQSTSTDGSSYRVSIQENNGTSMWIYVSGDNMDKFQKDSTFSMTKDELSKYKK